MNEYYLVFLVIIAWIIFRLFVWQRENYSYKCPIATLSSSQRIGYSTWDPPHFSQVHQVSGMP